MCTDTVTAEKRSQIMAQIKCKNTKPEMIVRSLCHAMGLRFRLYRRDLPGSPDLVFPKYHLCLFVHGCFWHRHGCRHASIPKTRAEYWTQKFDTNASRDERCINKLKLMGWRVEVIWECELKDLDCIKERIQLLTTRVGHERI